MDIYNLGLVSWWESQCYYHALAYLGREGVIICRPAEPYVCLGLHDDLEQEIDQEFCRERGLPILRRETGGGVVYLDSRQIFYQVVLQRDNPRRPMKRDRLFAAVLAPAIDIYRSFGLAAELAPPADIQVDGRKCSGNASGDIGQSCAYVGNLLLDFDFEVMSRILKVKTLAFRTCLRRVMQDNMLTLSDGQNDIDLPFLEAEFARGFERQFGELRERRLDQEMRAMAKELKERLTSKAWLLMPGRRTWMRRIKIAEGLFLQETRMGESSPVLVLIRDGVIETVTIPENPPRTVPKSEWQLLQGCWQEEFIKGVGL
jgi:lipoate-protein ligase A